MLGIFAVKSTVEKEVVNRRAFILECIDGKHSLILAKNVIYISPNLESLLKKMTEQDEDKRYSI